MSRNYKKTVLNESCEEDTIQTFFYVTSSVTDEILWDDLCKSINTDIESLCKEYIWHKDVFQVFRPIYEANSEDNPLHLTSSTSYGDNIEDEWFIVHIILELTKQHKDFIVQVKDDDGDFLLIEAADYLPSWANPESTENRVFIHKGHIYLIPPHVASLDEQLLLKDAILLIQNATDQTLMSADIEQAILNRIGHYPQKMYDNIHIALVEVPIDIATILKLHPNLIAPIIDAYCHHDIIDAKAFKNVSFDNYVTVKIKFTKCLYAKLLHSKPNNFRQSIEKNKNRMLGMKLACGFQLIMKSSEDVYSSKEYLKFLQSLQFNGYFKDNIEGSQEYKQLLQNAKNFFSAVECPVASNISIFLRQVMATEKYKEAKELLKNEDITELDLQEDNDDWLTIHPEQLNELLNSRYGKKTKFQKGDILNPEAITTQLNDFLKQTSDFEGIETNNKEKFENHIDFDCDEFVNCLEKMLNICSSNKDTTEMKNVNLDSSDDDISQTDEDDDYDKELKEKLHGVADNLSNSKTIFDNMVKSMKEEKASMGPSSNLISNVGHSKTDFLDSDDD